jgi:hypothetical protein
MRRPSHRKVCSYFVPPGQFGPVLDGGKNAIAILSKGGATIEAEELARTNASAAWMSAIADALIEHIALHRLERPRSSWGELPR